VVTLLVGSSGSGIFVVSGPWTEPWRGPFAGYRTKGMSELASNRPGIAEQSRAEHSTHMAARTAKHSMDRQASFISQER
jgi:hypothetical protein